MNAIPVIRRLALGPLLLLMISACGGADDSPTATTTTTKTVSTEGTTDGPSASTSVDAADASQANTDGSTARGTEHRAPSTLTIPSRPVHRRRRLPTATFRLTTPLSPRTACAATFWPGHCRPRPTRRTPTAGNRNIRHQPCSGTPPGLMERGRTTAGPFRTWWWISASSRKRAAPDRAGPSIGSAPIQPGPSATA